MLVIDISGAQGKVRKAKLRYNKKLKTDGFRVPPTRNAHENVIRGFKRKKWVGEEVKVLCMLLGH
jgi:hypothetical protein